MATTDFIERRERSVCLRRSAGTERCHSECCSDAESAPLVVSYKAITSHGNGPERSPILRLREPPARAPRGDLPQDRRRRAP